MPLERLAWLRTVTLGGCTGIVDKHIQTAMMGLNMLVRSLDGFVAGKVELDRFDDVGCLRTFFLKRSDGCICFIQRTAAHKDVIWLFGLQKRFHSFIPNPTIAS